MVLDKWQPMDRAFWRKRPMHHLPSKLILWCPTALPPPPPNCSSAHGLCVCICMYLRDGFAWLIFQVKDRALGGRLMSGVYRFSKWLKSLALQLISLSPFQNCEGWVKETVMMPISLVCKSRGARADNDREMTQKDLQAIPCSPYHPTDCACSYPFPSSCNHQARVL